MSETVVDNPIQWLDAHGDDLYRYACCRMNNEDDIADVVQETLVHAAQSHDHYKSQSSPRTWLIGILKNKIADHYRRQYRHRPQSLDDQAMDEFDHAGKWKHKPRPWPAQLDNDLEKDEFIGAFQQCLETLPDNARNAFLLRECEQQESKNICQVLDVTATNLWQLLSRARHQLRRCLEHNWFRADRRGTST